MTDTEQLKKRFAELHARAGKTGVPAASKFLNIAEQSELAASKLPAELYGGYDGAERRVAVFGAFEGYEPPIVCVRISPVSKRFADELTHRDLLGALMALGVTRETLGDIIVTDNEGYLICLAAIADYIIKNLEEVKRTSVRCELSPVPETRGPGGGEISVVVPSERLDAVVAAVYRLSREDAKAAVFKGLVFVDSRQVLKAGAALNEGAAVTFRGKGRFTFLGVERETKKGRLRVRVLIP